MSDITIVKLKDWQPYLSQVPDEALSAIDYALKEKYGHLEFVNKDIAIKVEIFEVNAPTHTIHAPKESIGGAE